MAIIGSTGAGKSTLVNLVPRLFDATSGTVRIDGVDVRDLDPDVLWSQIGLVPQRAFLFWAGPFRSRPWPLRFQEPFSFRSSFWVAAITAVFRASETARSMMHSCQSEQRLVAIRRRS